MTVAQGPWERGEKGRLRPFDTVSPANWIQEPPPYDWIVDGCFLRGTVAMLSGDGGLGKSLLMQQLCTAAATGQAWLGLDTKSCKAFAFFCEDDVDELRRRQAAINKHYGCSPADLTDRVEYAPRVGMENILVEFDRRTDEPKYQPLLDQVRQKVRSFGAQIIVLDTLADVFAGNEIIRSQVRRFVSALRSLAMEVQGVIVLTAHPSLTGMSSGTGLSGSTGWNNSVRSRLYLTKPKLNDDEEEDTNERLLKTMKSNHGPYGGKIRLRWQGGIFERVDSGGAVPAGLLDRLEMDGKLVKALRKLVENGSMVHAAQESRMSLSNLLRPQPEFRAYSHGAIMGALERLIAEGKIVRVEIGPASKRRKYVRTPDMRYPGEVE